MAAKCRPPFTLMPHVLENDAFGSSTTTSVSVWNPFGGQVIGSTARLRRATSGSGSPRKDHYVPVALVGPERHAVPVGVREPYGGALLRVPLEIREAVVEHGLPDG